MRARPVKKREKPTGLAPTCACPIKPRRFIGPTFLHPGVPNNSQPGNSLGDNPTFDVARGFRAAVFIAPGPGRVTNE